MSSETIKPCPACGYKANVYDYQAMSAVYCEVCGVRGPLGETEAEAIEEWNSMPRMPQIPVDLRQRIYTTISEPPCLRCKSRPEWGPSDCDLNNCQGLYNEETDAVLKLVEQMLGTASNAGCLRWTREKPSEPGFYFIRSTVKDTTQVSYVHYGREGEPRPDLLRVSKSKGNQGIGQFICDIQEGFLWAGPIPLPVEK